MEPAIYKLNKTTEFFYKINRIVYYLRIPNLWIEDLNFSKRFVTIHKRITNVNSILIILWIIMEHGAFFTQHDLTTKQNYALWMYTISDTILFLFCFMVVSHKETVKELFYNLTVALKKIHNDPEVERHMITSSTIYVIAFISGCILSIFMDTFDACMETIRNKATFTTVITAYPNVNDDSVLANIVRAICYVTWWIFLLRIFAAYILVVPITTCLSHQYKNLQSFYYSLNKIFNRDDLNQKEKEDEYEKQFTVGIQIHSHTIRCIKQCQKVCGGVFSGQIVLNILVIVALMAQMAKSERNLSNICAALITGIATLISTGFFMWNAGDVTVEASHLSTAIYFSGWENCQGESSIRIRNLVTTTMINAQRRVMLKGFDYIELSYQSYLTIVKSSYSIFSVLV